MSEHNMPETRDEIIYKECFAKLCTTRVLPRERNGWRSPDVQERWAECRTRIGRVEKLVGGRQEDRTPDLCIANAALSQLS